MLFLSLVTSAFIAPSFASVPKAPLDALARAEVWAKPSWVADDLKTFSPIDVFKGPEKESWLQSEPLECHVTKDDFKRGTHGQTKKFFCDVGDQPVKIKYKFDDGEIMGEIVASRLFWALGFGADRMYFIDSLKCAGCTADPFQDRRIDKSTLKKPRLFTQVAAERKFSSKQIGRGWTFHDLMETAPNREAKIQRDALRLLSIFIQHADNKAENQDLACLEPTCQGPVFALIQDLGATFGKGQIDWSTMSKSVYEEWAEKPMWKDAEKCIANLGMNSEAEMYEPWISEEAREFLSKLLTGFSEGPEGRKRVEDMFRAGHAELRGGTIEQWTDAFMEKVRAIREPSSRPDFKCPETY